MKLLWARPKDHDPQKFSSPATQALHKSNCVDPRPSADSFRPIPSAFNHPIRSLRLARSNLVLVLRSPARSRINSLALRFSEDDARAGGRWTSRGSRAQLDQARGVHPPDPVASSRIPKFPIEYSTTPRILPPFSEGGVLVSTGCSTHWLHVEVGRLAS